MTPPAGLSDVLRLLRDRKAEARAVGVEVVGVVGSLARGEATPDSDIDLIVRHVGPTSYFTLFDWERSLARAMGREIDLVFSEVMSPPRRAYIERDLVPL